MKSVLILFILINLLPLGSLAQESREDIERVRNEYESLLKKKYVLLPHKGNFLLPVVYDFNPNNEVYDAVISQATLDERGEFNKSFEAEFQISFLILIGEKIFGSGHDLFMGYTHHAWWQLYNAKWSRPFRETDYEPEVFVRRLVDSARSSSSLKLIVYDLGFVHQSNGQIQELSRSWNRLFARFGFLWGKTVLRLSLWYRIPEDSSVDQNPDIYKYVGYGTLEIDHLHSKNRFQLQVIPGTQYQGFEFSYSFPLHEGLRFLAKAEYGYGLSLIDYNHKGERIGAGFVLADPFSF